MPTFQTVIFLCRSKIDPSMLRELQASSTPGGGVLDQILDGDVPSRFQKHNLPVPYTNFSKMYTRLYTNFSKTYTRLYTKFPKVHTRPYTNFENCENRYRSLYQNRENRYRSLYQNREIDTLPDGTSPYPKYV